MHVQHSKYQQVSNLKQGELYLLTPTEEIENQRKSWFSIFFFIT